MRIIAGFLKGHRLYFPQNRNIRPLKDRARESIFNILMHSKKISFCIMGAHILDLYAGTGSFGLECLSRKAKRVCFVENQLDAIKILKKNIKKLKLEKKTDIFFSNTFHLINNKKKFQSKFDLIFCDPPFADDNIDKLLKIIFENNLLKKNGIIILHRNKNAKEKLPNYLKIIDEKIYGISSIKIGKILF